MENKEFAMADLFQWLNKVSETGTVNDIDPMIVRAALEEFGANFEALDGDGRKSLSKYSNASKHEGMDQVWGSKRKVFRDYCDRFVLAYEHTTGQSLPEVKFADKPSKTEGMRGLFGELTAYAANCLTLEDLKIRVEARAFNFGKPKDERTKITVVGYNKDKGGVEVPFAPASFPPEFPKAMWELMLSWKETR